VCGNEEKPTRLNVPQYTQLLTASLISITLQSTLLSLTNRDKSALQQQLINDVKYPVTVYS
jgi:hypothetical protein